MSCLFKTKKQRVIYVDNLSRGAESKTKLSLVDAVELGRAYEPITGERFKLNQSWKIFIAQMTTASNMIPLCVMLPSWTSWGVRMSKSSWACRVTLHVATTTSSILFIGMQVQEHDLFVLKVVVIIQTTLAFQMTQVQTGKARHGTGKLLQILVGFEYNTLIYYQV